MTKLGKLKQAGIEHLYQVALYMPSSFSDLSNVIESFNPHHLQIGIQSVFCGMLEGQPSTSFKNSQPMTKFSITDGQYIIGFTLFGDVREYIKQITECETKTTISVIGELIQIGSSLYLNGAKVVENDALGKVLPVYPGIPGKLKPDTVYKLIHSHIEKSIPLAANELRKVLTDKFQNPRQLRQYLNAYGLTMVQILNQVHCPENADEAYRALSIMSRIAAIVAADDIIKSAKKSKEKKPTTKISGPSIEQLLTNIPFNPTDEQMGIVHRAITAIASGQLLDILIIGDVGTGKTVVYSLMAAYVALGGGRVAVMLPNGNLSNQIFQEFQSYFPELSPLLVTSEQDDEEAIKSAKVLIGTTALLHRDVGQLAMAVFDESQKMAVSQQQQLLSNGTHKISVSATPIPRTMALANYGAVTVEKITKCHVEKNILTRIMGAQDYQTLIAEILWVVHTAKKQALIVCARKDDDTDDLSAVLSVKQVADELEHVLPGLIAVSHSGLSKEDNAKAIQSLRDGSKRLLVATTVVEVGMTLPDLMYAAVFNAENFGLNSLHQIRGRVGRAGGDAYFVLYTPNVINNPKTIERLAILVASSDGFYIAKKDLELRGVGDISKGSKQHGAYIGLVRNVELDINTLERVVSDFS